MKKILIVEDESLVALDISLSVESLGYICIGSASNFDKAIELAQESKPDLALMDICIKGEKDGIDVAMELKSKYNTPIIYITALNSEEDIQRAIKTNPSAYLIKPFDTKALEVAMKIALNKSVDSIRGDVVLDDEFSLDTSSRELVLNGEFINLTKKEYELLTIFLEQKNRVVDIYEIENRIWPDKDFNINTLRALVARLRVKLNYRFIDTIPSVGYKFTHY